MNLKCSECGGEEFTIFVSEDMDDFKDRWLVGNCKKCGHSEALDSIESSQRESDSWVKIGEVAIDTGTIVLIDPANLLIVTKGIEGGYPGVTAYAKYPIEVEGFIPVLQNIEETIWRDMLDKNEQYAQIKNRDKTTTFGDAGLGVLAHTGYGDGVYEVFARFQEGRIVELRVRFDEALGFDDETRGEKKHFVMSELFEKVADKSRLEYFSKIIGRKIESTDDLTEEEIERINAKLQEKQP